MEPTIVSGVAVIISVATAVVGIINHKRIRSKCCGKEVVASVDIENTTPPRIAPAPALELRQQDNSNSSQPK